MKILSIDIGNTRIKIAAMEAGEILHRWELLLEEMEAQLPVLLRKVGFFPEKVGWISVGQDLAIAEWSTWENWEPTIQFYPMDRDTQWPIPHEYGTPETLGPDRIVAIIGAQTLVKDQPILVIDAGTAITYDCARADGTYLGGAIGPGLQMRFRALHEFTARLPLISRTQEAPLIGKSTEESIQSGVIQAMTAEIFEMINRYREQMGEDMVVFLTGGDGPFFEKRLKNINIATSSIIHRGIYHILLHSL